MKTWITAVMISLMLIIGLKDGRVAKIDGYPAITFDAITINGETVPCVIIIIGGKAYPIPIELIDGMIYVPDNLAG